MNSSVLNKIINNGFKSEVEVKYFFTETRLFLDYLNSFSDSTTKKKYKVIKFYADWMLHIKKNNLNGMHEYFKECDKILNERDMLPERHKFNDLIESFTSFSELRQQLKKFLEQYKIQHKFTTVDSEWNSFSNILRKLILRKPIIFEKFKSSGKYRKMKFFYIDTWAPVMIDIDNAVYWILFIDTSEIPLVGVIPESIGLK